MIGVLSETSIETRSIPSALISAVPSLRSAADVTIGYRGKNDFGAGMWKVISGSLDINYILGIWRLYM